jgi:starch phosphorylase
VEIREAVGDDNIAIFGLKADEVMQLSQSNQYNPRQAYTTNPRLEKIVGQLIDGTLPVGRDEFRPLYDYLVHGKGDYFEFQDFAAYLSAQAKLDMLFRDKKTWRRISACNIAHAGIFSSDHTVTGYAMDIWHIRPVLMGK